MVKERVEPERFIPILEPLRDLLLKYELIEDATLVAELVDLAHLESPDLVVRLQGGEVWGKGLADIAFPGNLEGPEEELWKDDTAYRRLLIALADEMNAQGISSNRSQFIADAFREGLNRRSKPT